MAKLVLQVKYSGKKKKKSEVHDGNISGRSKIRSSFKPRQNMVIPHGFNSGMENGTNGRSRVLRNSN